MKKRISMFLAITMMMLLLVGCGEKVEKDKSSDVSADPNEDILTIEFFQQKSEEGPQKGYQAIIDKFNNEYPNIKIEMNTVPDAGKVLTSRIASNDIPTIFSDYPTQLQFKQKVESGYVENLTGQEFLNRVNPSAIEMSKANDGDTYALPYSNNFMAVCYNKDIFEDYDLKIPETFDEFVEVCEILKQNNIIPMGLMAKDPGRIGHTFQCATVAWTQNGVESILKATKGEIKVAENEEMKAMAEKFNVLFSYSNEDMLGASDTIVWEEFANGKYAMCITGSYARGTILVANPELNMGIFPLPNDTKETTNVLTGVDAALCISAKASDKEKEAALKFLDFLSRTENAQIFCDMDGAPSCITEVVYKDDGVSPVIDMIKAGQVHDWMASTIPNNVVQDLYNVTQQFVSERDVDQYLTNLDSSIKITSEE